MRTGLLGRIGGLGLALLLGAAWNQSSFAGQIVLTSASVIGGNGAWNTSAWDVGPYNALHVVDQQTGSISEPTAGNYWLGREATGNQYFVLDLGAAYTLNQIDLFNTHNQVANDRGTRTFRVFASNSVTFVDGTSDYDLSSATLILSGTLSQQTQANDPIEADGYTSGNGLNVGGTTYRYVRFNADTYYGSGGTGLNEIRLYGVPEPSTVAAIASGGVIGGIWLWRRKRNRRSVRQARGRQPPAA